MAARPTIELEGEIADLKRKLAAAESSIVELESKLLKDVAAIHRSLIEYKKSNDTTVVEIRTAVESMLRRGR